MSTPSNRQTRAQKRATSNNNVADEQSKVAKLNVGCNNDNDLGSGVGDGGVGEEEGGG